MGSAVLSRAQVALSGGDWAAARLGFETELSKRETAEALDGLSRALWWEGDENQSLAVRQRAYAAYRKRGDRVGAVRCALWIADEYRTAYREQAASNGWMARAQRLSDGTTGDSTRGWLALAHARWAEHPDTTRQLASEALTVASSTSDLELETLALAWLGLARVAGGEVKQGLAELDEAMAMATSQPDLSIAGDVACILMQAAELIGDLSPFMNWSTVVERYVYRLGHSALISACGTCCGEVFAANGDFGSAEAELLRTIAKLDERGHRSRCSHPSAALASLRIRQGRLKDAEAVLAPFSSLPESVNPRAELLIAQDQLGPAIKLLERHLARSGRDHLGSVSSLSLLAQAQARDGRPASAASTADDLSSLADRSGLGRVRGLALLAAARAEGDMTTARPLYEQAIEHLETAGGLLEPAIARLELARLLREADPVTATYEARNAAAGFERMGAGYLEDQARAFLRSLGVRGQTGPRLGSRLTQREAEVLSLIAEGLTNAEIAERLFISPKTAANHVGNVLMKLGVRTRTEAAAVALTKG